MIKKIETKKTHDGYEVVEDGQPVGRITVSIPGGYAWKSYYAKPPFQQGRTATEVGALAHLGYKLIKETKNDSV